MELTNKEKQQLADALAHYRIGADGATHVLEAVASIKTKAIEEERERVQTALWEVMRDEQQNVIKLKVMEQVYNRLFPVKAISNEQSLTDNEKALVADSISDMKQGKHGDTEAIDKQLGLNEQSQEEHETL